MIGAIIGDIVGSRFEFNNYRRKDFDLFTKDCKVTDDSIMTLAVAKSIMETEKILKPSFHSTHPIYYAQVEKMSVKYMQEIGRKYPNCGYGGRFKEWVHSDNPRPYNSFGNGAAMRVSPVGFAAKTEREVSLLSKAVTRVTHNHQEGIKGAEAVAVAIYMAQRGWSKDEIQKKIEGQYYPLDFTIDEIRDSYKTDLSCQGTVPQAIKAFLESTSFEDAVRNAISIGGDSDTIAAITGAIAESYYGVPADLKEKALTYLDNELLSIYHDWEEYYEERKNNKQVS
jgi:type I restriction enzyme M protein